MKTKKKIHQVALIFSALVLLSVFSARATEIIVSNKTALNTAISAAQPGDIITMSDGTWTNTTINLTKAGNSTSPITLRAKTPGKVILNGTSTLTFSAAYWVVSGLNFNQGALSSGQVVLFSSTNCRLTNSGILNYNPPSNTTPYYWIFFSGSYNRVDHCYFEGKNHQQPVVGNDFADSRYNRFDNNYVYNIPYIAGVNGREIMRIWGYGRDEETGDDGAFFTVESNLFEKADGEGAEIVSLKSSRNIVRYNTILGSRGSLNVRGGKYNTVHGNFILGQNAAGAYGIRVSNQYQTITNNYIANCLSGINLHVGEYIDSYLTPDYVPVLRAGTPLGRVPVYTQLKYCTIAFNTVVNVSGLDLEVGSAYKGYWPTQQRVLIPENNKIANNLFVKMNGKTSVSSPTVDTVAPLDIFTFAPNTYEGNIVYGGAINLKPMPSSGFSTQNPLVSLDSVGIYRIAANSPAINAAAGIYNDITDDMDGQTRSGTKDIGADEYSTSAITRRPLTSSDFAITWTTLEAPTTLKATVSSGTQIDLSWNDNSTNENSFSIERSLDGFSWSTLITTAADTISYSDTGLTTLTKYYYRVKAVKSNGSTEYSNTVNATTPCSFTNIALNKTATASSTYSPSYEASKSVDGSYSTRWASASGVTAATLEVDLDGLYTFSQVVLREYNDRVSSYKIQYWNGTDWIDAYTGTTIGPTDKTANFTAVTGTKVRLNILTCSVAAPSIYEFVVNGYKLSNIALNKPATASSIWSSSYEANKSVDGSYSTRWASSGVTAATLEVDLGETYTFSQVVLREYNDRVSSYKIQYWNGTTWLDTYTGTTIGSTDKIIDFESVTGTKVRLNILTCSVAAPSIYEFVVNGSDCSTSMSKIKRNIESNAFIISQLSAYPNPVKNNLTISCSLSNTGYTTLDIYNISGSKVKSIVAENTATSNFKTEVNVNDLPNGMYIVKLINGNNIRCVKFSVER